MSIVVKCHPVQATGGLVTLSEPARGAEPQAGDEAFIWFAGGNRAIGLAMRGTVLSVAGDSKRPQLTISIIDPAPERNIGRADLEPYREDRSTVEGLLAEKLFFQAHNKIAPLSPEEADFLREHFAADISAELTALAVNPTLSQTTRKALIDARIGQGRFRDDLLRTWDGRCALTRCAVAQVLRASHIKSWRDSTDEERLDPDNGILLIAQLDAMFDAHLISFDDDGNLLISPRWPDSEKRLLPVETRLSMKPNTRQRAYLAFHRRRFSAG